MSEKKDIRMGSILLALIFSVGLAIPTLAYDMGKANWTGTISLGEEFSGAIDINSALWMWGDNSLGQLGNGGEGNAEFLSHPLQTVPVQVMFNIALPTSVRESEPNQRSPPLKISAQ